MTILEIGREKIPENGWELNPRSQICLLGFRYKGISCFVKDPYPPNSIFFQKMIFAPFDGQANKIIRFLLK
jgi:hypothetical protein